MHQRRYYDDDDEPQPSSSDAPHDLEFSTDGVQPTADAISTHSTHENVGPPGGIIEIDLEPTVRTRLLNHQDWDSFNQRPAFTRNTASGAPSRAYKSRQRAMRRTRHMRCWAMPSQTGC
jgi:hypothetical protein